MIGLTAASNPIAIQMRYNRNKLVDTTADRIERVGFDAKTTFDDVYATLDVPCDFTENELRRAYRQASRECHPDKGGSHDEFTRVARAHEILSDAKRREEWDAGAEVVDRPQEFPLKDELIAYYWPEQGQQPCGDVDEHRRPFEKTSRRGRADGGRRRDAARAGGAGRGAREAAACRRGRRRPSRGGARGWWPWSRRIVAPSESSVT